MSVFKPAISMSFETAAPLPGYTLLSKSELQAIVDHNNAVYHALPAALQTEATFEVLCFSGDLKSYPIRCGHIEGGITLYNKDGGSLYNREVLLGHEGYLGHLYTFDESETRYVVPLEYGCDIDVSALHTAHVQGYKNPQRVWS